MSYYKSKTAWEDSMFGGTLNILQNHPRLSGWNITIQTVNHDKISSLFYYEKEKLAKILLYKVYKKNKEVITTFLAYLMPLAKVTNEAFYFSTKAIRYLYNDIMNDPDDTAPLFNTFRDDLFNLEIKIRRESGCEDLIFELAKLLGDIKEIEKFSSLIGGSRDFETKFINADESTIPIKYDSEEVLYSNQLISSLDLNFATGVTRHDNLITGKLAEHKLGEAYSGNTQIYYREQEKINTKPFHVCILMDQSGSMEGRSYASSGKLLKVLYRTFSSVLPSERLSIYGHTGDNNPVITIYHEHGITDLDKTYEDFKSKRLEENYDGPVTEELHKRIRNKTKDPILMIIVSDGMPCGRNYGYTSDIDSFKKIIERAKRDEFIIAGIGIDSSHVDSLYKYHTVVKDSSKIVPQVSRLVNFVVKTEFQL